MARVLEGMKVVELGTFITGPYAGMLLADLGADVIKVEQPGGGDPFRGYTGTQYSHNFHTYNARAASRSTKSAEARECLLKQADVMAIGAVDMLIPPSGLTVLLGSLASISISGLLIAGIIPGLILAVVFIGFIIVRVKLDPSRAPANDTEDPSPR